MVVVQIFWIIDSSTAINIIVFCFVVHDIIVIGRSHPETNSVPFCSRDELNVSVRRVFIVCKISFFPFPLFGKGTRTRRTVRATVISRSRVGTKLKILD